MESALSIQARVSVTRCILLTSIMMTYRPAGHDMLHCSAEWRSAPLFTLGKRPCFTKAILPQSETFFCYTVCYFLKTINTLHILTVVNECFIFAPYSRGSDCEKRLWNQLSWLRQALYVKLTVRRIRQLLLQQKINKYYIFWVSVCSLKYPVCNSNAPYCHLTPARLYNIFPYYPINSTIFEKCYGTQMCISTLFITIGWIIPHSKKNCLRYDKKCVLVFM